MRFTRQLPSVLSILLGASLVAAAPAVAQASPADASMAKLVGFVAHAYGSSVDGRSGLGDSKPSAPVSIDCTREVGLDRRNTAGATDIDGVGHIGAVQTSARTNMEESFLLWATATRSRVASASLLPGDIEIGAVQASARAARERGRYEATATFSIESLMIAGTPVELTGGEQVIPVDGVGTLTLGKTSVFQGEARAHASATAVELTLLDGSRITLGHADALIARASAALYAGGAFGTKVEVAGRVTSGRSARQPIPCFGTHGRTRGNEAATVRLDDLGNAAGMVSTVRTIRLPSPTSEAQSDVANVDLGDLVLRGLRASIRVVEDDQGTVTYDASGTDVEAIQFMGSEVELPEPGHAVELPGYGTLYFAEVRVVAEGRGAQVTGIRLELTDDTEVVLGRAAAVIK
jgi:hypothetical protein